jgi:hypothetical protein
MADASATAIRGIPLLLPGPSFSIDGCPATKICDVSDHDIFDDFIDPHVLAYAPKSHSTSVECRIFNRDSR